MRIRITPASHSSSIEPMTGGINGPMTRGEWRPGTGTIDLAQVLVFKPTKGSEIDLSEIERAVAKLAKDPGGGLMVPPDTYMVVHRGLVISSAAQHRLPAIFTYRQFAREGALITYGPETTSIFHRAASYVDRILRGANPGDLPAQAPTKFELAINLRTARMLGLEVPATLVALADEVIE